MSRRSRSSAVSTLIHGAASSRASGSASSRRQIAVTIGPFADVRRKSGCTSRTRSTNRRTAGERTKSVGDVASVSTSSASGPTAYSRSPRRWSGARLVTSTRSAGDRCQQIRDERRRVQDLLEIVEHQQRGLTVARELGASRQVERRRVHHSKGLGDCRRHERGVPNRRQPRRTAHGTPSAGFACASSSARRVFPAPPGPVSVMRRVAGSESQLPQRLHVGIAAEKGSEWLAAMRCHALDRRPLSGRLRGRSQRAPHGSSPVRSSAADSARTVSTWGRRRSPRSSALTA